MAISSVQCLYQNQIYEYKRLGNKYCIMYIFQSHLVDVVLLLLGEAKDVEGIVGKLHVLLVVNAVHRHFALHGDAELLYTYSTQVRY
jgi:hypothetical protein